MIFSIKLIGEKRNEKASKNIIKSIFLILFLFILLRIKFRLSDKERVNLDPTYKKVEEFEKSNEKSFFISFFIESEISEIKQFRKYNSKNELIDKGDLKNFHKNNNPEVSVIITVYNEADCFYKGLRSVQNQSLKNLEIIIVDDHSSDNSVDKIEKYQKEDNRIILLKHSSNYGKIKSRSDAISLAKGKYITIIDGDDALAKKNILFNSLSIAKIGNLDIIEFKFIPFYKGHRTNEKNAVDKIENIYIHTQRLCHWHKSNRIIYQPELKHKFINLTQIPSVINRNIWQKLIKNDIFKKVVEYIGPKYIEAFMLLYEDTIMAVSLFIISKSYYVMKDIGYYYSRGECLGCAVINKKCIANNNKDNIQSDSMKYIYFLSEKLSNNRFNGLLIYNELLDIINSIFSFEENIKIDLVYIYEILDYILKKFKFYNTNQKDIIINFTKRLNGKEKFTKNL